MSEDLKIEVGKTYKIVSYENIAERTTDSMLRRSAIAFLAAAPFSVCSIGDYSFKIVGCPEGSSFSYKLLKEFAVCLEEAEPLRWEKGKMYSINPETKDQFERYFGLVNRNKQMRLLEYLGDKFTVNNVIHNGNVMDIIENREDPPNHATYVLESTDRRYFSEIGPGVVVEPLEKKLRAFFELQMGNQIDICDNRGQHQRMRTYDEFVDWLETSLKNGVTDLGISRRQYQENLDTVDRITETINAALKG